jgi:hypothetical protein
VEDQSLFGGASVVDLHPIIFEEAYVKEEDNGRFVKLVKGHSEVYTEDQMLAFEAK